MNLTTSTKIHQLLKAYPFLEEFLVQYNHKFEALRSKAMRATVGRVASLKMVASIGEVALDRLLADIAAEIERQTGEAIEVDTSTPDDDHEQQERIEVLKQVVQDLHDGGDLDDARQQFAVAIKDVGVGEIAAMEQQLIRDGMPVEEVQRLCDVHVGAFQQLLDKHTDIDPPVGHPAHTYMAENRRIEALLDRLTALTGKVVVGPGEEVRQELATVAEELGGLDNHYVRKENQLFPMLEKHGIDAPPKVMWAVHDEIRATLKAVRAAIEERGWDALDKHAPELARSSAEMIYKEEKILLPMCMDAFDEDEWREVRRGEDELGYAFAQPGSEWPPAGESQEPSVAATGSSGTPGLLAMQTGELTLDQVNLMLIHLPMDISFVDENDVVRYYSEGERHFPRSPAVIGRKVQNCHPPASVHTVQQILDAFRAGERDSAEFWIQLHGKFLHIRYFAMRDSDGTYRGCLEAGQDVTEIRKLDGERRLLDWGS
jgi:hypothetical protein